MKPYCSIEMSTYASGGTKDRALDGITSGIYNDQSCTHTVIGPDNFWKVNFGMMKSIRRLYIFNRLDCCEERLTDIVVKVGEHVCGCINVHVPGKSYYEIDCGRTITADDVTIIQTSVDVLTICEVIAVET